jgi:hypothetical protein
LLLRAGADGLLSFCGGLIAGFVSAGGRCVFGLVVLLLFLAGSVFVLAGAVVLAGVVLFLEGALFVLSYSYPPLFLAGAVLLCAGLAPGVVYTLGEVAVLGLIMGALLFAADGLLFT